MVAAIMLPLSLRVLSNDNGKAMKNLIVILLYSAALILICDYLLLAIAIAFIAFVIGAE